MKKLTATTPILVRMQMAFGEARYLPRTLRMIWTAAGGWTVAWAALLFIQGLLPIAVVYLVRAVVNALVAASATGGDWLQVRPALYLALALGGIMVLTTILHSILGWVRTNQADLVSVHIADLIHRKCGASDLSVYETPNFYDLMHQARSDASSRPLALLENIGGLLQSAVTLIGMAAVLIPLGLWLPLLLVLRTLPAFFTVFHFARQQYIWRTKVTPVDRRSQYFDWLLTSVEPAAETRLFGTEKHFRQAYQDVRRQLRLGGLALQRREAVGEFYAAMVAHVITGATLAWMVWRTLSGPLVLGDLVLFYQAFNQGQQMLRALLGNTQQIFTNLLFLGKLYEFLALEARVVSPPKPVPLPPVRQGIRFEHVRFRYPGGERVALEDFNVEIPAGRISAILGPNGSGKSTVLKLLCRLYDPEAGRITIDGVDLRAVSLEDLRRTISPLFQAPVHYSASVRENIALDEVSRASQARIEAAARTAGAHEVVARLPGGYDCMLGKGFASGTELSGGEWQRIALARAFLRTSPLLLLDEPTSAMDSWAEADWIERLRQAAQGRTTIIITHRMSTAMCADAIFVMDLGRVVESGSHRELLAVGGRYAAAWAAQSEGGSQAAGTNRQAG
jgi:ATP-binding cassette subfamily B protein